MSTPQQQELQDLSWCIVELMGHRKLGGKVREVALAGTVLLRADVPVLVAEGEPEKWMTQFYGGSSIYCLTPTTEELARAVAYRFTQPPVSRYELPPVTVRRDAQEQEDHDGADPDAWEEDDEPDFTADPLEEEF